MATNKREALRRILQANLRALIRALKAGHAASTPGVQYLLRERAALKREIAK